jgi:exodeoxyribonuclease VII large subunit
MQIINRRFPNMPIEIVPVKVQGEGAAEEIAEAIELLNDRGDADVILVARGGGSLEDLQGFNSEVVARAIFSCGIPVVSAVGHETDFTIADFAADLRAPTPSAAAELVVPVKAELARRIAGLKEALRTAMVQELRLLKERTLHLSGRLIHPRKELADYRLRLDDAFGRVLAALTRQLAQKKDRLNVMRERLARCSPQVMAHELNAVLQHLAKSLLKYMQFYLEYRGGVLRTTVAKLNALSPLQVLERGYSVTRTLPDFTVVRDVHQVNIGQHVEVTVSKGGMVCRVERKR